MTWTRSEDGYTDSKDGRFSIYPQPMGTTKAQGYELYDHKTGARSTHDTQAEAKAWAQHITE